MKETRLINHDAPTRARPRGHAIAFRHVSFIDLDGTQSHFLRLTSIPVYRRARRCSRFIDARRVGMQDLRAVGEWLIAIEL